jgi:hypothetical protein
MDIYSTNDSFDFNKLILTKPVPVSGGNFFIKCLVDDFPLYIQPPKCKTKQGIVKANKRLYSDLMFTNENETFIRWMENLENHCQQNIYKNREKWFNGELEMHDIENYFTSPLKLYKSGKYYIARTNITSILGKPSLKIYDENENEIDIETIGDDTDVMTILEIQGIKCSSKSFQIEIELKQMMVLQKNNLFERCLIKPTQTSSSLPSVLLEQHSNNIETEKTKIETTTEAEIETETEIETTTTEAETTKEAEKEAESLYNILENDITNKADNEIFSDNNKTIQDTDTHTLEIKETKMDTNENGLLEVDFHLEELKDTETISIKKRDNIYYEMYKEAKKKAKIARDLALSTYLEAKRIKNTYMLEDLEDDDDEIYENDEDDEDDEDEDNEDNEDLDEEENTEK